MEESKPKTRKKAASAEAAGNGTTDKVTTEEKPKRVRKAKAEPTKEGAVAAPKKPRAKKEKEAPKEPDSHDHAKAAAQFAFEKKATDVRILGLADITSITDYFVIATGNSDPQVKA